MKGHLKVRCGMGHRGHSVLREQSFAAPLHVSKPHLDPGGALVLNVVNPTAGLFDGDDIEIEAAVESGAHLVMTAPSAARVYCARQERPAVVRQRFTVEAGGMLECFPEVFIPQRGARYQQSTELRVARGGHALFFEWLSPGRVASGERFAFQELRWDTDVFFEDRLIARERYRLSPDDHSLASLKLISPEAHYIGCFAIGAETLPQEALEALSSPEVHIGFGPLSHPHGWTVKVITTHSLAARKMLEKLRGLLNAALGRRCPL